MAKELNESNDFDYIQSHCELDDLLLAAMLQPDPAYPWNPADAASESYFAEQEAEFSLEDWSDAEIAERANAFFGQLNQQWTSTSLMQRFAHLMPQQLLQAIAHKAQAIVNNQLSEVDRLVQCVQDLLPNILEDDLQVQARRFVLARGVTVPESTNSTQWEALSELEQTRRSLAVASQVLAELRQQQS